MADPETRAISWYSPDPRAIIPLDEFPISRSLRQTINKHRFEVRLDTAFESVIRSCADREETWISDEIIAVYTELHRSVTLIPWNRGLVACWQGDYTVLRSGGRFSGSPCSAGRQMHQRLHLFSLSVICMIAASDSLTHNLSMITSDGSAQLRSKGLITLHACEAPFH